MHNAAPTAGAKPREMNGSDRRNLMARLINDHEAALEMGERLAARQMHEASETLYWSEAATDEDRWGIGLGDARNCACSREA